MSILTTGAPQWTTDAARRRLGLPALALCVLIAAGCFDHRRAVAFATLADASGRFHQDAYDAALRARFPPGSPVAALTAYVAASGGTCDAQAAELSCRIPLRGVVCGAELIGIRATRQDAKLVTVEAFVGSLGC